MQYNKKKIQVFVVNMTFISSREGSEKLYISFVPSALMKYIEDIQVFGVNMSFISLSEVKKNYIS